MCSAKAKTKQKKNRQLRAAFRFLLFSYAHAACSLKHSLKFSVSEIDKSDAANSISQGSTRSGHLSRLNPDYIVSDSNIFKTYNTQKKKALASLPNILKDELSVSSHTRTQQRHSQRIKLGFIKWTNRENKQSRRGSRPWEHLGECEVGGWKAVRFTRAWAASRSQEQKAVRFRLRRVENGQADRRQTLEGLVWHKDTLALRQSRAGLQEHAADWLDWAQVRARSCGVVWAVLESHSCENTFVNVNRVYIQARTLKNIQKKHIVS